MIGLSQFIPKLAGCLAIQPECLDKSAVCPAGNPTNGY